MTPAEDRTAQSRDDPQLYRRACDGLAAQLLELLAMALLKSDVATTKTNVAVAATEEQKFGAVVVQNSHNPSDETVTVTDASGTALTATDSVPADFKVVGAKMLGLFFRIGDERAQHRRLAHIRLRHHHRCGSCWPDPGYAGLRR